jgi:hypothetical protein
MVRPLLIYMVLLTVGSAAEAASRDQIMFSRYLRYQVCMERVYKPGVEGHGNGVYARIGLGTRMNRWGVTEPTGAAIEQAPLSVRKADKRCRLENELEDEPRPN